MKYENQNIDSGDNSSNVQINGPVEITVHVSSPEEVKNIILEPGRKIISMLSEIGKKEGRERREEFADITSKKLYEAGESAIMSVKDPAMQMSMYEGQKQYVKTGDKIQLDMLVGLLVERAQTSSKDLKGIIIDEALSAVSKLTREQIDILTVNFLRFHILQNFNSIDDIISKLELTVPFLDSITHNPITYKHLVYLRCAHFKPGAKYSGFSGSYFSSYYPGFFQKGFEKSCFEQELGSINNYNGIIDKCFHDDEKYEFKVINREHLSMSLKNMEFKQETETKLKTFFAKHSMKSEEVENCLISLVPKIALLFKVFAVNTPLTLL